jgi:hypothetical protein
MAAHNKETHFHFTCTNAVLSYTHTTIDACEWFFLLLLPMERSSQFSIQLFENFCRIRTLTNVCSANLVVINSKIHQFKRQNRGKIRLIESFLAIQVERKKFPLASTVHYRLNSIYLPTVSPKSPTANELWLKRQTRMHNK